MTLEEELKDAKERLKKARKKIDEKSKISDANDPEFELEFNAFVVQTDIG